MNDTQETKRKIFEALDKAHKPSDALLLGQALRKQKGFAIIRLTQEPDPVVLKCSRNIKHLLGWASIDLVGTKLNSMILNADTDKETLEKIASGDVVVRTCEILHRRGATLTALVLILADVAQGETVEIIINTTNLLL